MSIPKEDDMDHQKRLSYCIKSKRGWLVNTKGYDKAISIPKVDDMDRQKRLLYYIKSKNGWLL